MHTPDAATPTRHSAVRRWGVGMAVAAVLAAAAAVLYADPAFVVMLADQMWACF